MRLLDLICNLFSAWHYLCYLKNETNFLVVEFFETKINNL